MTGGWGFKETLIFLYFSTMHWSIAAPFTSDPERDRWLVPFVPGNRHQFTLIAAPRPYASWHQRARGVDGAGEWVRTFIQAGVAWRESRGVGDRHSVSAARIGLRDTPESESEAPASGGGFVLNMGALHGGAKGIAARTALARISRFIVHSRAEIPHYAAWLRLPIERFTFRPLQRAAIEITAEEDRQDPFVLAMGSAKRDYATLFAAVRSSKWRTLVVAAPWAVQGLEVPSNVELLGSLSSQECRQLTQRARVNVVPVLNAETASGQVTILDAMRMGRAVVATRCIGSEDYSTPRRPHRSLGRAKISRGAEVRNRMPLGGFLSSRAPRARGCIILRRALLRRGCGSETARDLGRGRGRCQLPGLRRSHVTVLRQ